jgi:hypothetical protein
MRISTASFQNNDWHVILFLFLVVIRILHENIPVKYFWEEEQHSTGSGGSNFKLSLKCNTTEVYNLWEALCKQKPMFAFAIDGYFQVELNFTINPY